MAQNKKTAKLLAGYLIVGDDMLKREAVVRRLKVRMAQYGDISLNSDTFDGEKATGEEIVAAANTIPFASEKRLVLVRDGQSLRKADSEALVTYLEHPCETTVLALECVKLAKNTRLYQAFARIDATAVIDCSPPKRYELASLVRSMAVGHGIVFTEGAAEKLIELVGENTVTLDNETKKIATSHRGSDPVTVNEVLMLIMPTAEVKPWEFVDAFAARDLRKCIAYLRRMSSTSPLALIAMCTTRIRELICTQSLLARGQISTLGHVLKQPDWRLKNHRMWANRFSAEELRNALILARDAEQEMKRGADQNAVFIDWVIASLTA